MPITEIEYIRVSDRAAEIGCPVPEIAIMPENFEVAHSQRELRVKRQGLALRSILEHANFPLGSFCASAEHTSFGDEDLVHWEASLFVSAALLAREPYAVAVALSIVRDHLADYFSSQPERIVRLTLVVERKSTRTCRKLIYEGDAAGLRLLAKRACEIADE